MTVEQLQNMIRDYNYVVVLVLLMLAYVVYSHNGRL